MNNKEEIHYPEGILLRKSSKARSWEHFSQGEKKTIGRKGELFSKVVRLHALATANWTRGTPSSTTARDL